MPVINTQLQAAEEDDDLLAARFARKVDGTATALPAPTKFSKMYKETFMNAANSFVVRRTQSDPPPDTGYGAIQEKHDGAIQEKDEVILLALNMVRIRGDHNGLLLMH
jgi:hypothetical protein